jgi:Ca-activated chloride channel family protein
MFKSKPVIALTVLMCWAATVFSAGQSQQQSPQQPPTKTTKDGPLGAPPPPPMTKAQKEQAKRDADKKAAEQPDQSIELSSQLVSVPFTVTDKRNAYINDLKKEDIRVLEDNKPQQIFSIQHLTDLPLTMVLLMDTSLSQQLSLPEQISAANQFFRSVMKPNKDTAAIVTFEGDSDLVQRLTGDQHRLMAALDKVRINVPPDAQGGTTGGINPNSRAGSTAIFDAIYATVDDLLAHESGRRIIILLTDGQENSSRTKVQDAIKRAWQGEVQIYAVGVEGAMRQGGYVEYSPINTGLLNRICEDTGGRAFFPRRDHDLTRAFQQLEDDMRQQYILSYSPVNAAHDGSFRTIKVEVATRNDLQVRHRRGYFAASQKGQGSK